jgi:superfamily I DNA/RNA helicase
LWVALKARAQSKKGLFATLYEKLEALQTCDPKAVHQFLSSTAESLRPWPNLEALMTEVRSWLAELRTHAQSGEGAVKIMTFQAAKGLEAEVVCVVGLNDGIVPRRGSSQEEVQETARLLYVTMTRAEEELHLFHARKRRGSITYLAENFRLQPSPFIRAINRENRVDLYYQPQSKARGRLARTST